MMHCLTVLQPFATAIALADPGQLGERGKRVENRGWAPPKQLVLKHFAIHAGKKGFDQVDAIDVGRMLYGADAQREVWQKWIARLTADSAKIIAVARLVGSGKGDPDLASQRRWKIDGQTGWWLDDVRALPWPILFRGMQGLWQLPAETEAQVRTQVGL